MPCAAVVARRATLLGLVGVAGVPESFLINPAGLVVSKIVGGVRAPDLEDLLARAKSPPSQITKEKE